MPGPDPQTIRRVYKSLRLIRRFEEEVARIYPEDKIKSPVHLSIGQESVAVEPPGHGVALCCAVLH